MCRRSGDLFGRIAELLIQPVIGEGSQEALPISAKPKHGAVATAATFVQPSIPADHSLQHEASNVTAAADYGDSPPIPFAAGLMSSRSRQRLGIAAVPLLLHMSRPIQRTQVT